MVVGSEATPSLEDRPSLLMFFYGTLKRGHRNHEAFCSGARFLGEAAVRGSIYNLPYGYPALTVPRSEVLAVGTADLVGDATVQRRLGGGEPRPAEGPRVFGELFAFDDPGRRLPVIDRLEGFDAETGTGPYRRVLLPAETARDESVLAWAYVVEASSGVHLPGGRWPA
jgi:gamma-glutamylcyclotransferase (GGCT)/AIG2-like uncharacterized protein YtfP